MAGLKCVTLVDSCVQLLGTVYKMIAYIQMKHSIVILSCLQSKVLNDLHVGRLGIVRMKGLARSYCY